MKITVLSSLCLGCLLVPAIGLSAVGSSQVVQLKRSLEIPGATLGSGKYTFAIEDQLSDRAIIRVTNEQNSEHYLLLAVPAKTQPQSDADGLSYFSNRSGGSQSLRTWKCQDCASAVEFVYPKLEAVKITGATAKPVLAVDPDYDKLPGKLSADDMKVVTLWTLSPERISNHRGEGVKAAKYDASASAASAGQDVAAAPAQRAGDTASARMPRTASNTFSLALYGLILLAGAVALRLTRIRRLS